MRRTDTLLGLIVGAFALFVGVQLLRRPTVTAPRMPNGAPAIVKQAGNPAPDTRTTVVSSARSTDRPPPAVDRSLTASDRAALIAGTPGTYMPDMLADLKGMLVRWPDRREQGLRIWVQSMTNVRDWDLRYAQMARDGFADWSGNLPIRFDFVLDSATSDVQIVWIEKFPPELGRRVGTTNRTSDQNGWIVGAQIIIAVHDSTGRTIPPGDLAGIVRHEAGHALGLGHSNNPATKMYPVEMVNEISSMDRATLKLLYQMVPGAVH
ncbi:MAG: peptidase and matrixin and adamalysin [Gemmatimonadetes bacterium]|nr:peptidase and matrixin and adamalysin [Gemmatimonadota bacterium]